MTALLLLAAALAAQEPAFEIRGSSLAELGVPAPLSAAVRVAPGTEVELDPEASSTDTYRVAGVKPTADGWAFQVLPLGVGRLEVSLSWKLKDAAGARTITSPPFFIEARAPELGEDPELKDIRAPLDARAAFWPWLLAAALAAAAVWYWRRKKDAPAAAVPAPVDHRPPHRRALDSLMELEASPLWNEGRYKDFYIALTEILRGYLDAGLRLPAQHMTTSEIARGLREAEIDRAIIQRVRGLFDRADLVKFAKTTPSPSDGPAELDQARLIVEETMPREPTAKEAGA
jgi:hypothetical protein